jgi:hypothetical protein
MSGNVERGIMAFNRLGYGERVILIQRYMIEDDVYSMDRAMMEFKI